MDLEKQLIDFFTPLINQRVDERMAELEEKTDF